jgi:vesicle transport through interaction with t-SNAREs protein 1
LGASDVGRGEIKDLVTRVEGSIRALKATIRDMEVELRSGDPQLQNKYDNVLARMKAELSQQDTEAQRRIKAASNTPSATATGGGGGNRDKLLQAHQVHQQIDETTGYIKRDLEETEKIGIAVNSRLANQREQLESVRDNLEETEDSLARSKKVLNRMGRRVLTDKCTQFLIIVVEIAIIGIIVWAKYFKDKK